MRDLIGRFLILINIMLYGVMIYGVLLIVEGYDFKAIIYFMMVIAFPIITGFISILTVALMRRK
ncbi:hypothetical protein ASG48_14915 [Aurantimonas sp. Leaf443]|nr:hypothetical protein ASG48_14915 [Aurantimonas sp. Leaf443]